MTFSEAFYGTYKLDKKDGKPADATVIATGIMVNEAMLAAEELAADGIEVRVENFREVRPINVN